MYEEFKSFRDKRYEDFKSETLPILKECYDVIERDNGSFSIDILDHGIVDFYPKKNRLLFRRENRWISNGLNFIKNNLI